TNLAGKIVLITGAAKGIGRATALAFAAEGSQLALLDWDEEALAELKHEAEALGATVAVSKADLSSLSGMNDGIDSVLAIYGRKVDVRVNNVGSGAVRMFDDLTDEDWEATMQLNFMSYVRACRKILPVMRAQQSGVIINNASDLARQPE
ncbi:SDR family NAD(P)-dependent oxidoreductase, partial [Pseudomonas viridiflava]|uniref:SDR family NAD(P)-dependent oxidoreductase n=1 Tax=Pseudomonas viridiflava TaxID=33069 RepID=UPI000F07A1D7